MSEITVTIEEEKFNELAELLTILSAIADKENKELHHKILYTYAAFHSAREKADIKANRCYCCHKEDVEFYTNKDGKKSKMCKRCETDSLDIFHPEWSSWLFEKYDIPLIYEQWFELIKKLTNKYTIEELQAKPDKVFSRYFSVMKLLNFRPFKYNDSNHFNRLDKDEEGLKI